MPPRDLHSRKRTGKIDISNEREISKWCKSLKCDKQDLVRAVLAVGDSAKMVDDFLVLNRKKEG